MPAEASRGSSHKARVKGDSSRSPADLASSKGAVGSVTLCTSACARLIGGGAVAPAVAPFRHPRTRSPARPKTTTPLCTRSSCHERYMCCGPQSFFPLVLGRCAGESCCTHAQNDTGAIRSVSGMPRCSIAGHSCARLRSWRRAECWM
eukprot:7377822-Prymnesium_polylepis.3